MGVVSGMKNFIPLTYGVGVARTVATVRHGRVFLLLLMGLLFTGAVLSAQTASYTSTIRTLASGFFEIQRVAVDGNGNVYFTNFATNSTNGEVWEIEVVGGVIPANPTIRMLASGLNGISGIALDSNGNVFIAVDEQKSVCEIEAVNGVIPANPTIRTLYNGFKAPTGVAVDASGNVYVADDAMNVNVVYEIEAVSGVIPASPTIRTLGSGFLSPYSIAVDGSGNVYVVTGVLTGNTALFEIEAVSGVIPANPTIRDLAGFGEAEGIAVDSSGNVYVSDVIGNAVYEIEAVGGVIPASPTIITLVTESEYPNSVAVDGRNNVYFSDISGTSNYVGKVYELIQQPYFGSVNIGSTATATLTFTFSAGGSIAAPVVMTQGATGLDFTDAGTGSCTTNGTSHVYASGDTCTVDVIFAPKHPGQRLGGVQLVSTSGSLAATASIYGTGIGPQVTYSPGITQKLGSGFKDPFDVAVDGSGNVYVADTYNSVVKEIMAVGGSIPASPTIRTLGSGFSFPGGVAVDGSGNVYVANTSNKTVKEIEAVGGVIPANPTIRTLGSGFSEPRSVVVDGSGNVFVTDTENDTVNEIEAVGGVIPASPTILTLGSGFNEPAGIAVDGSGNVYVADIDNNAVKEIEAVGGAIPANPTIRTLGSGFSWPVCVGVDSNGNVYVADTENSALKEILAVGGVIPASPTILTLVSGFNSPGGFRLDASGNIYIANGINSTVYELNYSTPPTLTFATPTKVGSTDTADGAQTVTIINDGNANLNFTLPTTGNNPSISSGFAYDATSTCPQLSTNSSTYSLAEGASCTYAVDFIPIAAGTNSGALILTDNNLNVTNVTQTIPLLGTGTGTPALLTPGVAFSISPAPYAPNQLVTVTITVSSGSSNPTPTGTVSIVSPLATGSATLISPGVATIATTLPIGQLCYNTPISVQYSGDSNYNSVTTPLNALMVACSSATTLAASPISPVVGQAVTLTASVMGVSGAAQPTLGTVTFLKGTTTLGTATINSSGIATYTTTLPYGTNSLTAQYSGESNDFGSTSAVVTANIALAATTTTLTATPTTAVVGQTVLFTATVTPVSGSLLPTGSVSFLSGGNVLGTSTVIGNGVATFSYNSLPAGSYCIVASYSGDTNNSPSNSSPCTSVTVSAIPTTTTLAPSIVGTVPVGQAVTLTATVTPASGATPTGTVTFTSNGNNALGTASLNSSGIATLTISPAVGSYSIVASYAGSTTDAASTSAAITLTTIQPGDFSISASPASQTVYTVQAASYTIAVVPSNGFSQPVALTCSGAPANTTCNLSPSTLNGGGNSTLTLQTIAPGPVSALHPQRNSLRMAALGCMLLILLPRRLRRAATSSGILVLLVMLALGASLTGCTTQGKLGGGTPVGSYQITINTSANNGVQALSHSTTVTLNVNSLY